MQEENSRKRYRLFSSLPEKYDPSSEYFMEVGLSHKCHHIINNYGYRKEKMGKEELEKILGWIKFTHFIRKSIYDFAKLSNYPTPDLFVPDTRQLENIIKSIKEWRTVLEDISFYLKWYKHFSNPLLLDLWISGKEEILDREVIYNHNFEKTTRSINVNYIKVGRYVKWNGRFCFEYLINEEWKSI